MALLLHIDTSTEKASVCLSENEQLLQILFNQQQKDHAAFIQPAIEKLLADQNKKANQLAAIAVTSGPGSYTGLRVGMATAKGLCYALQIPLITVGTFEVMTFSTLKYLENTNEKLSDTDLFCPMIDARRQEVYTALLNQQLQYIYPPTALVLTNDTFIGQLNTSKIFFYGNGAIKFMQLCHHPQAQFLTVDFDASHLMALSYQRFSQQQFADLAYAEPFYGKEFYSTMKF